MTYRVIYKRFMLDRVALVEDNIEADDVNVLDGCLILSRIDENDRAVPFLVIPPTLWLGCEESKPDASTPKPSPIITP